VRKGCSVTLRLSAPPRKTLVRQQMGAPDGCAMSTDMPRVRNVCAAPMQSESLNHTISCHLRPRKERNQTNSLSPDAWYGPSIHHLAGLLLLHGCGVYRGGRRLTSWPASVIRWLDGLEPESLSQPGNRDNMKPSPDKSNAFEMPAPN
jgi:hypothetical protein